MSENLLQDKLSYTLFNVSTTFVSILTPGQFEQLPFPTGLKQQYLNLERKKVSNLYSEKFMSSRTASCVRQYAKNGNSQLRGEKIVGMTSQCGFPSFMRLKDMLGTNQRFHYMNLNLLQTTMILSVELHGRLSGKEFISDLSVGTVAHLRNRTDMQSHLSNSSKLFVLEAMPDPLWQHPIDLELQPQNYAVNNQKWVCLHCINKMPGLNWYFWKAARQIALEAGSWSCRKMKNRKASSIPACTRIRAKESFILFPQNYRFLQRRLHITYSWAGCGWEGWELWALGNERI